MKKNDSILENIKTPKGYMWIYGYKSTNIDGYCDNGRFYEPGKITIYEGRTKKFEKGIHFSIDLKKTIKLCSEKNFLGCNKFFKVKGLVKKIDYLKMIICKYLFPNKYDSIFVSNSIDVISEITNEEYYELYGNYRFVESVDDIQNIIQYGYYPFCAYKLRKSLEALGMSNQTYQTILQIYGSNKHGNRDLYELYLIALALKEENICHDLSVNIIFSYLTGGCKKSG